MQTNTYHSRSAERAAFVKSVNTLDVECGYRCICDRNLLLARYTGHYCKTLIVENCVFFDGNTLAAQIKIGSNAVELRISFRFSFYGSPYILKGFFGSRKVFFRVPN